MSLIDLLWEKDEPSVFITKEQYAKNLEGWDIRSVEIEGEVAFITIQRGACFHFQSFDKRYPITRKMIREFLAPIIKEYGYAETKTPIDDQRQHRFNLMMGFFPIGEDLYDVTYRIERIRGKCQ